MDTATKLGGPAGEALLVAARESFTIAMQAGAVGATLAMLLACAVTVRRLGPMRAEAGDAAQAAQAAQATGPAAAPSPSASD